MAAIAVRNLWERKLRTVLTVAGDRARGDDGRRHLRPHRHDRPLVRTNLHAVQRGRRRGRHLEAE